MSIASAQTFVHAARNAPKLREEIAARPHEIPEERLAAIIAVAKGAGFSFTGDEYIAALRRMSALEPHEDPHRLAELF